MKNLRKRLIAIAVLSCMTLSAFTGCGNNAVGKGGSSQSTSTSADGNTDEKDNKTDDSAQNNVVDDVSIEKVENEDGAVVVMPFQTGSTSDTTLRDPNAVENIDSAPAVTTKIETVVVTDADGAQVTDAGGVVVTSTNVITAPAPPAPSADDYKSATDSMYCLWIDISKDENYFFNNQVIKITFKIKDNIPSKDYAVRFNPDLSSVSGVSIHPDKVAQGTIRVGSGDIEPMDVSGDSGFVAYGDNIACNQGDTIDYYINFKENPGLAAVLMWFYYDKNAMDVLSVEPVGEFADIASRTQVG